MASATGRNSYAAVQQSAATARNNYAAVASPAVQQLAATARNVYVQPAPAPVAQRAVRQATPSIRSNPVVQELLSRAVQYYSQPVAQPPARVSPPVYMPQPVMQRAAPSRTMGTNDLAAGNALYDLDQIQYQIAAQQDRVGRDLRAPMALAQLDAMKQDLIRQEESRRQQQNQVPGDTEGMGLPFYQELTPEQVAVQTNRTEDRNASQYYGGDPTDRDLLVNQVLMAYPNMTRTELAGRSNSQLQLMLTLKANGGQMPTYDPLSGDKAGTPQPPTYNVLSGPKAGTPRAPEPWDIGQPGGGAPLPEHRVPMQPYGYAGIAPRPAAAPPEPWDIGQPGGGAPLPGTPYQPPDAGQNYQLLQLRKEEAQLEAQIQSSPYPDPAANSRLAEVQAAINHLSGSDQFVGENENDSVLQFIGDNAGEATSITDQIVSQVLGATPMVDTPAEIYDAARGALNIGQAGVEHAPEPIKDKAQQAYDAFRSIAVPAADRAKWYAALGAGVFADTAANIEWLHDNVPQIKEALDALSRDLKQPWRVLLVDALNTYDRPRQWNAGNIGDAIYDHTEGNASTREKVVSSPVILAYEMWSKFVGQEEADALVKDAYENGYSSPDYIQAQLDAGVPEDQIEPQFTGGRAVWEALVGTLDGLSTAQRMLILGVLDTVIDPLTLFTILSAGGTKVSQVGGRMAMASDSLIGKAVGRGLEALGTGARILGDAPDAPFIAGGALVGKAASVTGNFGGALDESVGSLRRGAEGDMSDYERTLASGASTYVPGAAPVPAAAARPPHAGFAGATAPPAGGAAPGRAPGAAAPGAAPAAAPAPGRAPRRPVTPYTPPATGPTGPVPRRPRGAAAGATTGTTVTPPSGTTSPVTEAAAAHGVTLNGPPGSAAPTVEPTRAEPSAPRTTRTEPTRSEPAAPTAKPKTSAAEYPELAKAEARNTESAVRHAEWRDPRVPREERDTPLAPSTDGDQGFIDDVATAAVRSDDPAVKQAAEEFIAAVQRGPAVALSTNPLYVNFSEPNHVTVNVGRGYATDRSIIDSFNETFPDTFVGSSATPEGTRALEDAAAAGKSTIDLAATANVNGVFRRTGEDQFRNRLNSLVKAHLEYVAELKSRAQAAMLYKMQYGDLPPMESIFPEPPRSVLHDGTKLSWTKENANWLAWRYVTGSDADKAAIFKIWDSRGRMFDTSTGRPFPTRPPEHLTPEVIANLQEARNWLKTIETKDLSDPGLVRRYMDRLLYPPVHFAHPATMMWPGLGLRAKSKQLADWFSSYNELTRRIADPTNYHVDDTYLDTLYQANAIPYETAEYGSRLIEYTPDVRYSGMAPGTAHTMTVQEALEYARWRQSSDPNFNFNAERTKIANLAAGLPPETLPTSKAGRGAKASLRWYDKGMGWYRNIKLANPVMGIGGALNDIIGTTFMKVISGNASKRDIANIMPWRIGYLTEVYRNLGRDEISFATTIQSQYLKDSGQVIPADVMGPGFRGTDDIGKGLPPINAAVANKPWIVRASANFLSVPYLMDVRRVHELQNRVSIYEQVYAHELKDSVKNGGAFWNRIETDAPGTASQTIRDIQAHAQSRAGKPWNGGISPQDVKAVTGNEDWTRAWQTEQNLASKKAEGESLRVMFSGKTTKADEVARRAFTFHYWQSRASIFHLRTAVSNPILLNTYWKLWQDIDERYDDLPKHLQSMIKVFTTGNGISAAINGFSYLFPLTALDMFDENGNKFSTLFHLLAPGLQSILAIGGADYSPQLDPLRGTERLLVALVNQAKVDGVPLEDIPIIGKYIDQDVLTSNHWTEDKINAITSEVNQLARGLLDRLGISIGEFEPFDRGAYDIDLGTAAVQQVMEETYGPRRGPNGELLWDNSTMAIYNDALDDYQTGSSNNPIAQQAQEIVAEQQLTGAGLSAVLPGSVTYQEGRQEDIVNAAAGYEALNTGKELTPEQQAAIDNRQEAKSADPMWNQVSDAYHNLGTDEQRGLYQSAMMVINNDPDLVNVSIPAYNSNGEKVLVSGYELSKLTDEQRKEWVDDWLYYWPDGQTKFDQYDQERKEFLDANPEYQDYKSYQQAVYDDPRGFREGLAETDPNFQRAMDDERDRLEEQGLTGSKLEAELDDWATSEAAYKAAIGEKYKTTDPDPLPVYNESADVTNNPQYWGNKDTGTGGGGSNSGTKDVTSMESIGHGFYRDDDGKVYDAQGVFVGKQNQTAGEPDKQKAILFKLLDQYPEYRPIIDKIAGMEKPDIQNQFQADMADFQHINQMNEQQYPDYWDETTGEWGPNADSAKERAALGLPRVPYPTKTDMLEAYWQWVAQTGNTDINAFVDWYYQNFDRWYWYDDDPSTNAPAA